MNAQVMQTGVVSNLAKLREPFPAHQISKLPKETKAQIDQRKADSSFMVFNCQICGGHHHKKAVHLDYVGHAALTDRLLDVDPTWFWEPLAIGPDGNPARDQTGGLWIKLTVCGVTRLGYGSADGKTGGDAVKELIGDALRNAAMRFGAALELWHKGDLHVEEKEKDEPKPEAETPKADVKPKPKAEAPKLPSLAERANKVEAAMRAAETLQALNKTAALASGLFAQLDTADPERLAELQNLLAELEAAHVEALERDAA